MKFRGSNMDTMMSKVAKSPIELAKMAKPKKYSVSFKAAFAELVAMTLFVYIGTGKYFSRLMQCLYMLRIFRCLNRDLILSRF